MGADRMTSARKYKFISEDKENLVAVMVAIELFAKEYNVTVEPL